MFSEDETLPTILVNNRPDGVHRRFGGLGANGDCVGCVYRHIAVMGRGILSMLILAVGLVASPAAAHPHIFVEAGLVLHRDATGRVVEAVVTWRYDELYSLGLLEDYGLDQDYDLHLTEAEAAATLGFDLNWDAGFDGGLILSQNGRPLDIGAPEPVSLRLLPSGQLETTHRRPVSGAAPGGVTAQIYDPAFYIAFEMVLPVTVAETASCTAELVRADLDTAYGILEAALREIGGVVAAEDNFPAVGAHFADRVEVTCAESS